MKKILNHLQACSPKDILVIGDVMLDEYWFGDVSRISPEAPVPVLKQEHKEWCFGGASNVAANCKHIGFNVDLIGVIGAFDEEGARLRAMLRDSGIPVDGLIGSASRVTTCKKRMMVKGHQLLRIDSEETVALSPQDYEAIIMNFDLLLKPHSTILISDYAKGVVTRELITHVVFRAQQKNCIVLIDPKGPDFDKYAGVHYLKPNLNEFNHMVKFFSLSKQASLMENGRALCTLLALQGIFITLGDKGIQYVDAQISHFSPVFKREVYDITGAGDTVFAFLALGLSNHLSIEECLLLANRAAAVAISHLKTYAVSLDELIDREAEPGEKIFNDWMSLKIELDWQRRGGKRLVFTNGCFDILHSGHVHILKEAKKLGDILLVALNTDASVARLNKGPGRPINTLEERANVVAALGMVDFVVAFDQDTPAELIEYLSPDVLVKGGDYIADQIVGYHHVVNRGGEVKIIEYLPGRSTTNVLKKIERIGRV